MDYEGLEVGFVMPGMAPYATALVLARYLEQAPLDKAFFVEEVRRNREIRRGFNPYTKFCAACRADFRFGSSGRHLEQAVTTVATRYQHLYQQLEFGYRSYLRSLDDLSFCSEQKIRDAVIERSGLTLKINPHMGVRRGNGRVEATYMWFDAHPPNPEVIATLLRLMSQHMENIYPAGLPVVLDVRRGRAYRTSSISPVRVDRYIDGQLAAFVANWTAAA
ncbi:hypothetical protein E0504_47270 [Parafrankia sp. BMG5.11]|nr:hypothetical protein E0504_47270 [Parafrankia sp. BMG5.11]